jgi:putative endonuclease
MENRASVDAMSSTLPAAAFERASLAQKKARLARARRLRRKGGAHPPTASAPPARSPAQRVGNRYEDSALALLEAAGLGLLARNLCGGGGEIDLVMREAATLVFVEVRARRSARYGGAAASVGPAKQRRLRRAAAHYLPELCERFYGSRPPRCRFDVVAFENGEPLWLRDAFGAS